MKKVYLLISFIISVHSAFTQNFIPNGSFEQYALCPQSRNDGRFCTKWDIPTKGTGDYFNVCAPSGFNMFSVVDVPNNLGGSQSPRTGSAYCGFYACQNFNNPFLEYREYLQVTLDSILEQGGRYQFEMYLSLGDFSNFASNKIGAYFSSNKISANTDENLNVVPQIITQTHITDKVGWAKVTGIYVASGGERYITIGVFNRQNTHTTIPVPGGSNSPSYNGVAYYYIDDVSMTRECPIPEKILGNDISVPCANQINPITLSATTPSALAYLWNTLETSPTILARQSGTYIVKLTSQYCTVYDTVVVTYNLNPKVDLGNDTAFCGAFSLPLDAKNPGKSILWNTLSTQSQIMVTSPGTYFVRVNEGACFTYDTIKVTRDLLDPIDLGDDTTLCQNERLELDAFAGLGASYQWNTGNIGSKQIVSNQGKYAVTINKGACIVKDSIQINYQPKPKIDLGPDTSFCFNQPYKIEGKIIAQDYTWNTGQKAPFIVVTEAGEYWLKIIDGVCVATDTLVIRQKSLPKIDLGPDKKMCKEDRYIVDLSNQGQSFLLNNVSTPSMIDLKPPGFYVLQVFTQEGCFANDTLVLDTFVSPMVYLGEDTTVCYGEEIVMDAGVFSRYQWQDSSTGRTYPIRENGSYQVTVWDANGCKATDFINVKYHQKAELTLAKFMKVCNPDTVISVNDGFKSYAWSNGLSTKDIHIDSYGRFTIVVTDTNSCQLSASIDVENNCPGKVYVPNAFTPENKDGINDVFYPFVVNVKEIKFWVYNRWGELVFYTERVNSGWDGTYQGKPAIEDVYVYLVDYVAANNVKGSLKGNVTLLK